jgi:hypothetical protein
MMVYVRHCRMVDENTYCSPGIRLFCRQNKIDLSEFLKNGIDSEVLIATGDLMAMRVVEAARKEAEENDG